MNGHRTRIITVGLIVFAAVGFGANGDSPTLRTPDGASITFSSWCSENGPAALLLWASWSPDGEAALAAAESLQKAAAERGLEFVVVSLQEPVANVEKALGPGDGIPWLYDRHGALLKTLLVYKVPTLVIVSKDGLVLTSGPFEPKTIVEWQSP